MKRNKILRTLMVIMILLCTVSILFACGEEDGTPPSKNENDGSSGDKPPIVTEIKVTFMDGGEIIKETTIPKEALEYVPDEKEGFVFDGWYLDKDFTEEITTKPTEDVILYAKWSVATFRVTFLDADGQAILIDGEPYQMVEYGKAAIAPEDPEKEGYDFVGWNIDFSEVKSNLTIRPNFETEKRSIILYGEDGSIVKTEEVSVGAKISIYYSGIVEEAKKALPGGFNFVGLYADSNLENEYETPSGDTVMPPYDLHLYTKAELGDITGLSLIAKRGEVNPTIMINNTYSYDTKGFILERVLSADNEGSVITYNYEWRYVNSDTVISGETGTTLSVAAKNVGSHTYEVKATATYKSMTPVSATSTITVKVENGTLEGMITPKGFTADYNGEVQTITFDGTMSGDVISYRLAGESDYVPESPVLNARTYKVESKIVRRNYNPLELPAVDVTINAIKLTPIISLELETGNKPQTGIPSYSVQYGFPNVNVVWDFEGFVGNDNKYNAFDNDPVQVNDYKQGADCGEYYLSINTDACYVNNGEKPKNYTFGIYVSPLGEGKPIILEVQKRALTITLSNIEKTYGDEKPESFGFEVLNAYSSNANDIRNAISKSIMCAYQKGSGVVEGGYEIGIDNAKLAEEYASINKNYDVKINTAKLIVNPKDITIKINNASVTYGDAIPSFSFEATGLIAGDTVENLGTPIYVCQYTQGGSVKNYPIVFNENSFKKDGVAENNNYNITSQSAGVLKVNKKHIKLQVQNKEIPYGTNQLLSDEFEIALADGYELVGEDQISLFKIDGTRIASSGYSAGSDVQDYDIIAYGYDKHNSYANYYVDEVIKGVLTVTPIPLTIKVDDSVIKYGDEYVLKVSYEGLLKIDGEESKINVGSIITTYVLGSEIGEYKVEIENYTSNNYIIETKPGTLSVQKKEITIKLRDYSSDIENGWSGDFAELLGADLQYNVEGLTANGLFASDSLVGQLATKKSASQENYKGSYESDISNEAFAISEAFNWDTTFDIQRNGTTVIKNYTVYFDFAVAVGTAGVLLSNDSVYYDGAEHGISVSHMFAEPLADVYFSTDEGEDKTYSEANVNIFFTTPDVYTVYYKLCVFDDDHNYTGEEITGSHTITIKKRVLTLQAVANESVVYGDNALSQDQFSYELIPANGNEFVTGEGFVEGEDITSLTGALVYACDYAQGSGAGDYEISLDGVSSDNYDIIFKAGTLKVAKRELYATASSHTITYGDAQPQYTVTFTNFVNGDTRDSVGLPKDEDKIFNYQGVYDEVANRKSGVFEVYLVEEHILDNYDIVPMPGTLTVNRKTITVTAPSFNDKTDSKVYYGDVTPELLASVPGLVAGDSIGYNTDENYDLVASLSTAYTKGNNVGSYSVKVLLYDTEVKEYKESITTDKYIVSIANGTMQVLPRPVTVVWGGHTESYVYDGNDYSGAITAYYLDVEGKTQDQAGKVTITFKSKNANSSTPNSFQNAASYTVTATTSDANYKLTNATLTLTMEKAKYVGMEHKEITGVVYSTNKVLKNHDVLDDYWYWKDENETPTVAKTEYQAYYNADPENYHDFNTSVHLILTPATVYVENYTANSVKGGYDVVATIDPDSTSGVNQTFPLALSFYYKESDGTITKVAPTAEVNVGNGFKVAYSNGTTFAPGSHLTTMSFESVNYKFNSVKSSNETEQNGVTYVTTETDFFIKYQSVLVGSTYYTPEDALKNGTSGSLIVKANTSFASEKAVVERYYNDASYYTVASGATFVIPYSAEDTKGYLGGGADGSTEYAAHPEKIGSIPVVHYMTVTLPSNELYDLTVNGKFVVGALTGSKNAGTHQNGINGGYSVFNLEDKIVVVGELMTMGYIRGAGEIVTSGTKAIVTENMYLIGWPGGSIAGGLYLSNGKSVSGLQLVLGGTVSESNPTTFPIKQYELRSNQVKTTINYGGALRGYAKIATSAQTGVSARVTQAYMNIVTSSTTASEGLLHLTSGASVVKTFANSRVNLALNGTINDGYLTLDIKVGNATIKMTTEKVFFAVDGTIDIEINGTFNQNYKFKFLPGSTLKVNAGGTYNLNGTTVIYPGSYRDVTVYKLMKSNGSYVVADGADRVFSFSAPYPVRSDAKLYNAGTINLNGALGGEVLGISGGKVVVGASATIMGVKSIEGSGYLIREGATAYSYFTEKQTDSAGNHIDGTSNSVVRDLVLSGVTVAQGTTYVYTNGAWA